MSWAKQYREPLSKRLVENSFKLYPLLIFPFDVRTSAFLNYSEDSPRLRSEDLQGASAPEYTWLIVDGLVLFSEDLLSMDICLAAGTRLCDI